MNHIFINEFIHREKWGILEQKLFKFFLTDILQIERYKIDI